jgi:hypothetical protein
VQMRRFALGAILVMVAAGTASAQDQALSPFAETVICAPRPSFEGAPPDALRITGAQDPTPRALFGNRDLLVVGGGSGAGVKLGDRFFIRRTITGYGVRTPRGATTLGTLRVVAVNDSTSIGVVDHICNGIVAGDHLEPYVEPAVSAVTSEANDAVGEPDFSNLGRIVAGGNDRETVGVGDFALIDWGEAEGLTPGTRFAIFRDVGIKGLPLASVGEGVVISTGHAMALTRVLRAHDVVFSGDYIALRK